MFFSPLVSPASLLSKYGSSSMKRLIKLGQGCVKNPEDISVDRNGVLFTANEDGWVKKLFLEKGTLVNWKHVDSRTLLGITTTKESNVIVCDSEKGLLKISKENVTVLDGNVSFPNSVIEASNGTLYFSVSSTKYKHEESYKDLTEGKPYGQLLKYDSITKNTTILYEGFYFANGVALSKDEDFVVVCESWEFRCRRYWLEGKNKGNIDNLVEKLPGAPDNINLAPDGSFWIALIEMNQTGVKAIHSCREKNHLLETYPQLINLLIPTGNHAPARVVKVDKDGHIIWEFRDPNATYTSVVTSAFEFKDNLYLAGIINNDFIGKLPLEKPQLATILKQHHHACF